MPTEEQIMKMKETLKKGWILEVDLEYPEELHEVHNRHPLAQEKKAINPEQMSGYQPRLMADLNLDPLNGEKLVLTLEDKEKYVVHYRNLQKYLRQTGAVSEKGALGDQVRPRALDGAVHPDGHRVPEAGEKRIRDHLLQVDEQLRVRQNDGKPEEPRGREDRTELGRRQDPPAGSQPLFRQIRYLWKRPGRHPHAQNQALPEQAHVHRHDDSQEQQAAMSTTVSAYL